MRQLVQRRNSGDDGGDCEKNRYVEFNCENGSSMFVTGSEIWDEPPNILGPPTCLMNSSMNIMGVLVVNPMV